MACNNMNGNGNTKKRIKNTIRNGKPKAKVVLEANKAKNGSKC
jgi:hypothetical protein